MVRIAVWFSICLGMGSLRVLCGLSVRAFLHLRAPGVNACTTCASSQWQPDRQRGALSEPQEHDEPCTQARPDGRVVRCVHPSADERTRSFQSASRHSAGCKRWQVLVRCREQLRLQRPLPQCNRVRYAGAIHHWPQIPAVPTTTVARSMHSVRLATFRCGAMYGGVCGARAR